MISKTRKFVALTAMSALCGIAAMVMTGEAQGSRSLAADAAMDIASQRIEAAFQVVAEAPTAPTLKRQASGKGDGLPLRCGGEAWPGISAACLVSADGGASRAARTVTVEYRTGTASSALVRMPVALVAAR